MVARDVIEGNCIFILLIKDNIVRIRLHLKVSRLHDGTIIVLALEMTGKIFSCQIIYRFLLSAGCNAILLENLFFFYFYIFGGGGGGSRGYTLKDLKHILSKYML